nr:ribonuclease H-like domain-containing protein [Tanacetum cinerariifolium]
MANDEENHALVADEEAPTEFALMAKTNAESEVSDSSLCSKACKKNTDSLNSKITELTDKLFDAKNMICHYKLALAHVEARLAELRNQELKYYEKIRVLEFKTESSANCIESFKKELELIKKEKEGLDTKLTGFQTALKDLDSLLESQRLDKNKEGLGYRLLECADDTITDYSRPAPTIESFPDDAQNKNPFITEIEASPNNISPKPFIKLVKANDSLTKSKIDKVETAKKPPVKYDEQYRKPTKKSNKKGEKGISRSQNNTHKSFTPRPVVHKPYRPLMRPMRPNMNAAQPNGTSFNKPLAHSNNKRPFQRTSAVRSQFRAPWVLTINRNFPTVNRKFPTANRKFPTGGTKFSTADMRKKGKAGSSQKNINDEGYWDSGCTRHMTGNISHLTYYEPFDEGYVYFGQGGCKITGKGTIKIGKLEFENVYFVKDLKTPRQHNMYSIDLNNIVPHKDLTCLVAKASAVECMLWHRRLGHLNFKIMNRLVRHNLVRGLPSKCFENDHTCTACLKGKQHKASFNTACYVQNMVLVNKSQNKTPYGLFNGRTPATGFLKPFGCHVMILNTLDHLGKFEAKGDEGYFIRYSMSSKAFRVFNKRTKRIKENLHVDFLENKAIEKGAGPNWLFDIDSLTNSMNNVPVVVAGPNSNNFLGIKEAAGQDVKKDVSSLRYIALPNWFREAHLESSTSNAQDACHVDAPESSGNSNPTATSTNPPADHMEIQAVETLIPTISSPVLTTCLNDSPELSSDTRLISKRVTSQDDKPSLENILTLTNRFEDILGVTTNTNDSNGAKADLGNMEYNISASPTHTFRIHKDHPKSQLIGLVDTLVQTRTKSKEMEEQSFIVTIH